MEVPQIRYFFSLHDITYKACSFLLIADDCEDNMQLEIYNARWKLKVEVYHCRYLSWNISVLEVISNVIHKARGYSSYNFRVVYNKQN